MNYEEMKVKFNELLSKIEAEYEQIQAKMHHKNQLANETIMKTLIEISSTNF